MPSRTITAARQAQAQADMAEHTKEIAQKQEMFFEWMAEAMVAIDQRLQAIETAQGIKSAPPLPDDDDGTETPSEPVKTKRGRPRKEKDNG